MAFNITNKMSCEHDEIMREIVGDWYVNDDEPQEEHQEIMNIILGNVSDD